MTPGVIQILVFGPRPTGRRHATQVAPLRSSWQLESCRSAARLALLAAATVWPGRRCIFRRHNMRHIVPHVRRAEDTRVPPSIILTPGVNIIVRRHTRRVVAALVGKADFVVLPTSCGPCLAAWSFTASAVNYRQTRGRNSAATTAAAGGRQWLPCATAFAAGGPQHKVLRQYFHKWKYWPPAAGGSRLGGGGHKTAPAEAVLRLRRPGERDLALDMSAESPAQQGGALAGLGDHGGGTACSGPLGATDKLVPPLYPPILRIITSGDGGYRWRNSLFSGPFRATQAVPVLVSRSRDLI